MTFKAFAGEDIQQYFLGNDQRILSRISQESEDYILNVNEEDFIGYLADDFSIDLPTIDFESFEVSTYEKMIPAEYFPFNFNVYPGKKYPRSVYVYSMPYSGNVDLIHYIPNPRLLWTMPLEIRGNRICFEIQIFSDEPDQIKAEAQNNINKLNEQLGHLTKNVQDYNSKLKANAGGIFKAIKQKILNKNKTLAALGGVKTNSTKSYTVPIPHIIKKITVNKPAIRSGVQEYSIDQSTYDEILHAINIMGKSFERYPSTYLNKDEEALRDQILVHLEPRIKDSSITGETFNKSGKTDILIRYQDSNIFVAECKFWEGSKAYLEGITQLLGYLTWRDSKTALILFVRNKEFSSVLKSIEETTPKHDCYIKLNNKESESWFNYTFHLIGDNNREIKLAVLAFHLPS